MYSLARQGVENTSVPSPDEHFKVSHFIPDFSFPDICRILSSSGGGVGGQGFLSQAVVQTFGRTEKYTSCSKGDVSLGSAYVSLRSKDLVLA